MPPKVRELIAELERAGSSTAVAKAAIATLSIQRCPSRSQFLVRRETMLSIIKSAR